MSIKLFSNNSIRKTPLFFYIFFSFFFQGQAQIQDDPCFDSGNGALGSNGTIYCSTVQSDGKILIGGNFSIYNEAGNNSIVRINEDGSVDPSFVIGSGFGTSNDAYTVYSIITQPDGKILVGGDFTLYNGNLCSRVVRLHTNGALDTSFSLAGTGFNDFVYTLALQSDGKILVGGKYDEYNGSLQERIARLNTDGSLDTSFITGTGFNRNVYAVTLQPDGQILVGGRFSSYNGVGGQGYITRLNTDGSLDNSFNTLIYAGFANSVRCIAIQLDGKIVIAGRLGAYNGVPRNDIMRLNTDGSLDNSFSTSTSVFGVTSDDLYAVFVQSDGKILVGGEYSYSNNGISADAIVRLHTDGSLDTSFFAGSGLGYNTNTGIAYTISRQLNGTFYVGGYFHSYNDVIQENTTCVNPDGSLDTTFNIHIGLNRAVNTVTVQVDGKVLAGGWFTTYNGNIQNNLIRFNADGSKDVTFSVGTEFQGVNNFLSDIVVQPDGKILVGGNFVYNNNSVIQENIIRLNVDGTLDTTFNIGTGLIGTVNSLIIQPDGKILIGGSFVNYNGSSQVYVARLNTDGSLDTSFNSNFQVIGAGGITSLDIQSDGKILVAGKISTYNGAVQTNIVRLNNNGSLDNTFSIGALFNNNQGRVYEIKVDLNGKILVVGGFIFYNAIAQRGIIRLNNDGSIDTSFMLGSGFNDFAESIVLQPDGKYLIGGWFTSYDGVFSRGIIRLNDNGTKDISFDTGIGFLTHTLAGLSSGGVSSLVLQLDGKILVGGGFRNYNGKGKSFIARLGGSYSDINLQGNSNNIRSGQTYISNNDFTNFGSILECGAISTRSFVVQNLGSENLTINSIVSSNPDFTVTSVPTILIAGAVDTFMVSFNPSSIGTIQSIITIHSDDCDEELFTYRVQGIGTVFAELSINNAVCSAANGVATTTIFGGITPYAFVWSNGDTSAITTGLAVGNYTVTITDGTGCISVISDTISSNLDTILVATSTTSAACIGSNGTATVVTTGGTAPYSFAWSNATVNATATGLSAGTYVVTITDTNGCMDSISTTIGTYIDTIASSTLNTNNICMGSNGTATVVATGGTAPYSFVWSNGAISSTITGLAAGTYEVTITDSNGCIDSISTVVNDTTILMSATGISTNISCNNLSDGFISLSITGGTTIASYNWSNGATSPTLTGLSTGLYFVTITDSNNCSASTFGVITNPAVLVLNTTAVDASGFGLSDGFIDLQVSGGTPPYSFLWSNGATTEDISSLTSGNYNVTVTDANGCILSNSSSIFVDQPLGINQVDFTQIVTNLYPNPTREGVYLDIAGLKDVSVELIDMNGRLLQKQQNIKRQLYLDLSEYPSGIYFVRVYRMDSQESLKVIKF